MYELCKTRPPKLRGDKLVSLEVTWVTDGLMVMAMGKDGVAEGSIGGNVDTTFVDQDMVIEFSIQKTGPEGGGDILQG